MTHLTALRLDGRPPDASVVVPLLPSLMELQGWLTDDADPTAFLPRLPNLTRLDLDVNAFHRTDNAAETNRRLQSALQLHHCTGLTALLLSKCSLTSDDVYALLQRLPKLRELNLLEAANLTSLRCFSTPPLASVAQSTHVCSPASRPPSEIVHLRALRGLTHLDLRHAFNEGSASAESLALVAHSAQPHATRVLADSSSPRLVAFPFVPYWLVPHCHRCVLFVSYSLRAVRSLRSLPLFMLDSSAASMSHKRSSPSDEREVPGAEPKRQATHTNDDSSSSSSVTAPAAAAAASSSFAAFDSAPAPAGSVLPSRFLPVVLRMVMQDLNPGVYSIPFFPTPLVDLIAGYAEEDTSADIHATFIMLEPSVHLDSYTVHSASGRDCIHQIAEKFNSCGGTRPTLAIRLAAAYARLDMPEAEEWRAVQGIKQMGANEGEEEEDEEEEVYEWTFAQQGDAATRMARALVAASKAPPESVHPSLAALLQSTNLLESVRTRSVHMRDPSPRSLSLWAEEYASQSNCTSLTSFTSLRPRTGRIRVKLSQHEGLTRTKEEEEANACAANATPPPFI